MTKEEALKQFAQYGAVWFGNSDFTIKKDV